ncbi:MAG TPA: type II toxin-antitoxin system VapC family toxin [Gammaproteobacteria bacterium]|nr:type II toxin-antitoxin system VapC family toxin [Gammaproteobacteria bacterium]
MIVLDTHALIWWVNGDSKLSARARKVIESEMTVDGGKILVSAISAWEIAMLVNKNRLVLTMDLNEWLDTVRSIDAVQFVPIDNEVAVQSVQLPGDFHPDPADRMITALARHYSAMLVTSDDKIRNYRYVKTIW